jgi:molybdopterin-guanine dinucleotide biosynthesis protein A
MKYDLSAVILAGGEGKRFGGNPKTELVVGGRSIISRMLDVIREMFDEIIIVTNSPERFSELEKCRIITDIFPGSGPLGGIHAAMKASEREALFVFAGDMPFLNKGLIIKQIEKFSDRIYSALVPVLNDLEEPLHAIYINTLSGEIEEILERQDKPAVKDLLENINTGYMKLPPSPEIIKAFTNINSPSDLEQAENFYLYHHNKN